MADLQLQPDFTQAEEAISPPLSWSRALALAIGLTALLGMLWWISAAQFDTNDDAGMMFTAAGIRTGTPSPYLVFSHIYIGTMLVWLYQRIPDINWYACYLLAAHALALTVIFTLVLRRTAYRWRWLVVATLAIAYYGLAMSLQFTSTAMLLGLAGVLLLLEAAEVQHGFGQRLLLSVLAVLLMTASTMIRAQGILFAFVVGLPFAVYMLRHANLQGRLLMAASLLGAFILMWSMRTIDRQAYLMHPEWQSYFAYNQVRGKLHDTPVIQYTPSTRGFYTRLGWSENDTKMFLGWFFADEQHFSLERLQRIYDTFPSRRPVIQVLRILLRCLTEAWTAILLTLALCWWMLPKVPPRTRRLMLGTLAIAGIVFLALAWTSRLPGRVLFPGLLIIDVFLVLLFLSTVHWRGGNVTDRYAAKRTAVLAGTLVLHIGMLLNTHLMYRKSTHGLYDVFSVLRQQPNAVYLVWGAGLPVECMHPITGLQHIDNLQFIWLGCSTFSPHYYSSIEKHDIANLYTALYTRPELRLVCSTAQLPLYKEYVREHYDINVLHQEIAEYSLRTGISRTNFGIYRLSAESTD